VFDYQPSDLSYDDLLLMLKPPELASHLIHAFLLFDDANLIISYKAYILRFKFMNRRAQPMIL
jgi:hypothetical protein